MDAKALRPNTISIPSLDNERDENFIGPSTEEKQLYSMSKSAGWKIYKAKKEQIRKELDTVNKEALAGGMSFEDIGRNTLVVAMAQDIIDRLLNIVDDAVDVCEDGK